MSSIGRGKEGFGVDGADDCRRLGIAEGRLALDLAFVLPLPLPFADVICAVGGLVGVSTAVEGVGADSISTAPLDGVDMGSLDGPAWG